MKYLDELNDKQREAVLVTEGPILILAGAGSGKTKTLVSKIAYLIKEKKVSPYNILAVTFTNKAANEMKDRISSMLSVSEGDFKLPWCGTFHSICVKILRREISALGFSSDFSIFDETDSKSLIKQICKDLKIDAAKGKVNIYKYNISSAKNEFINSSEYEKYAGDFITENSAKIYKEYQKRLKQINALDFDDLINFVVRIFEGYPEILEKYQKLFKYILVDEYQDTNMPQYLFCKMLAKRDKNICVVGDDWQAIYGFRGANFHNILNFEKDYPDAKVIKLEQNYRSTKNILAVADSIIKKNNHRTDKELWTSNKEGNLITLYEAYDQHDEIGFIANEILSLSGYKGVNYNDFVILYRTNAQSRVVEEVLIDRGIPYRIIGSVKFYERKEIKDILAYLRYCNNPLDEVSLERIINVPTRGIGKKTFEKLRIDKSLAISNKKIKAFFDIIDGLKKKKDELTPSDFIEHIAIKSGYKDMLNSEGPEGVSRLENIEELRSLAYKFDNLADFLSEVALMTSADTQDETKDAVTLMTLHNAKGLEYKIVFIVGLEEGIFPHSRSLMDEFELEEERRLAYVGVTRARENLYLSYAKSRLIYGGVTANVVSRFIGEIPEELIDKIE